MKIKKKRIKWVFLIFIAIVFISLLYRNFKTTRDVIYTYSEGKFSYDFSNFVPTFTTRLNFTNGSIEVYNVNFISRPFKGNKAMVYGLLIKPQGKNKIPGIIYLPGGGVKKEGIIALGSRLAEEGYAVLTIDQRGIGQTGGEYPSLDQDFEISSKGNEPIQHLSTYDGLAAFKVMQNIDGIDPQNIMFAGESMGGRYAFVATALEKQSKGLLIISSAGYHVKKVSSDSSSLFISSIDPDSYISEISPRPIFILHGSNDTVIPLSSSKYTFSLASEPKEFYIAQNCTHGFCENMWPEILKACKRILSK